MSSRLSWYLALASFSIYVYKEGYLNFPDDAKPFQSVLKYFEVGDELIIELGLPVDFLHGESLTESIVK